MMRYEVMRGGIGVKRGGVELLNYHLINQCLCTSCYRSIEQQRVVDIYPPLYPYEVERIEEGEDHITLHWKDNDLHRGPSILPSTLWQPPTQPTLITGSVVRSPYYYWDEMPKVDKIRYDNSHSKGFMGEVLEGLSSKGFIVVKDMEFSALAGFGAQFQQIQHTLFGGVYTFGNTGQHRDTAYSDLAIPYHTDGCYMYDPPGLQSFLCVSQAEEGGENGLCNGYQLMRGLPKDTHDYIEATPISYQYIDDEKGHYLYEDSPMIRKYKGEYAQVRVNYGDMSRVEGDEEYYHHLYVVQQHLHQLPKLEMKLAPGELLLFNNWRLLHNRSGFRGYRKYGGFYIGMQDYMQTLSDHGIRSHGVE